MMGLVKNDWWKDFFSGVAVDFWLAAVDEEQTRREADFLETALRLAPGAKVLDVPCGGGRHAHELAARGHRITGVDISEAFLNVARSVATDRSLEIEWQQREMRELPWRNAFDGAFCFGNSFGYLDDPGNAEFLRAVGRNLKPGRRFVLDTGVSAESLLPSFQKRRWYEARDILLLIENEFDHVRSRLLTQYTFIRGGATEKRLGWQRVYTYNELGRLLEEAGFGAFEAFASLDKEPFGLASPRLLLVAEKGIGH